MSTVLHFFIIGLVLIYTFVNGFQGSSSSVATIIASRALNPRLALGMSAAAVFFGPFLFGTAVAQTIGTTIINAQLVNSGVIIIALFTAIIWSLLTWWLGIPSSPSHALVGGMVGAAAASSGPGAVLQDGLLKVLLALFISPLLGLFVGAVILRIVLFLVRNASMKVNWWFKNGQIVTSVVLALSNGANDASKGMGILALGLVSAGIMPEFRVPLWTIAACSSAMALGTLIGGWRVIKTLGRKFFRIRPVDSFCSQLAAASVILTAALIGGPVSTTQVVSSTILGVGAAERMNKVRWGIAKNIGLTWLVTIPATMAIAWIMCQALGV